MEHKTELYSAEEYVIAKNLLMWAASKPDAYPDGLIEYGQLVAEFAKKGQPTFRDGRDSRLHHLLGHIGCDEFRAGNGPLCAIVIRKLEKDPGDGFYRLQRELFSPSDTRDPVEIWLEHVEVLHTRHAR